MGELSLSLTKCSSDKGWWDDRRRGPISPRAGLLRYVRPQGDGAPPNGGAQTRLWPAALIWQEKSNLKFNIYLHLCRNFTVFVLNLMNLYIKLRSVTLFLKLGKFVT